MTVQGAIRYWKKFLSEIDKLENIRPDVDWKKQREATAMAIEALEKQVPKKPDLEGDGYADGHLVYDTWICPNCGKEYEVDYEEYDWCPHCGQHIDRSE